MPDDDGKIKRLPVRFKSPLPADRTLLAPFEVPKPGKCSHFQVPYIVDPSAAEVECGKCHEKLNPMWVLGQLANTDRRMAAAHEHYQEEQKRLAERRRTMCQHCKKMTRISRR